MAQATQKDRPAGAAPASQRCRYAELMILCARIGFNP